MRMACGETILTERGLEVNAMVKNHSDAVGNVPLRLVDGLDEAKIGQRFGILLMNDKK